MVQKLELTKESSESLLLSLLEKQPMYGYQIIKELKHRSEGYFQFKEGTLYPVLHRLEKSGLVEGKWELLPSGRQRRYYHITAKGKELLNEKISQWQEFLNAMNLVIRPVNS
ncbi:MAG: PadR family transcriptional regulator [Dehalococcoidales bacterium]|nr:PadR family transcriptional regulator [Dehalococcoidales bacterium]